jgi:hypothetical protein
MDLISSLPEGATELAEQPADAVTSMLRMIADGAGFSADNSPDAWLGIVMSGLAGAAAALAVAIVLAVYFRTGYRSIRDIVRHGLAATAVLGVLAFVAYDMRHAALPYLGINVSKPEVEFETPRPKATPSALAELHTDLYWITRFNGR